MGSEDGTPLEKNRSKQNNPVPAQNPASELDLNILFKFIDPYDFLKTQFSKKKLLMELKETK